MWASGYIRPYKAVLAFMDVPVVRLAVSTTKSPWVESVYCDTQGGQNSSYYWGFFDHQCPMIRVRSREILKLCARIGRKRSRLRARIFGWLLLQSWPRLSPFQRRAVEASRRAPPSRVEV